MPFQPARRRARRLTGAPSGDASGSAPTPPTTPPPSPPPNNAAQTPPAGPSVRTLPRDIVFVRAPGETLLDAALRAGLPLASSCGGRAVCGDCVVQIVEGAAPPPDADEIGWRGRKRYEGPLRLACCLRPEGPLVIATTYW